MPFLAKLTNHNIKLMSYDFVIDYVNLQYVMNVCYKLVAVNFFDNILFREYAALNNRSRNKFYPTSIYIFYFCRINFCDVI